MATKRTDDRNKSDLDKSMEMLSKAVVDLVTEEKTDEIEKKILGTVETKVDDFINAKYGYIERKVKVTVDDEKPVKLKGVVHEKFDEVLKFVKQNEPVYLVGASGTGKSELCKQIAETLDLDFYFTNCVTREHQIDGFTDAVGQYHETQFYKAFTNGGIFFLDEIDASIPEVLVKLNGAIANGWYDFPAPIGKKDAHKDFRVVSAGNTYGYGASAEYVGRNQLDFASLDRFAVIEIDYSKEIERAVTKNNKDLMCFSRDFRKSAIEQGIQTVLSYRGMGRIAKMEKLLGIEETLKTCLVKGLDRDDVNMILDKMTLIDSNKYKQALRKVAETLE